MLSNRMYHSSTLESPSSTKELIVLENTHARILEITHNILFRKHLLTNKDYLILKVLSPVNNFFLFFKPDYTI